MRLCRWLVIGLINTYRYILSPVIPSRCRYLPTCSEYAIEAINKYGLRKGIWKAIKRVGRCHPWGGSGFDPP
jgi:putative membrane protein insertion efficiency factor